MDLFESLYNGNIEDGKDQAMLLDETFRKHYPQLHDFMVQLSHRGFKREHGRITLTCEKGQFKVTLSDPTGGCSFSILSESVEDGLTSMENHAENSAIHWYYWKSRKHSPPKKERTSSTGGGGKAES